MKQPLQRALALALASTVSLSLLSGVASLADRDREALAQAKLAKATLVAARLQSSAQ
jgi:hypothetical protein